MIEIETIETPGLGDHSYLATDGDVAVVVDPQRDIDRVVALLENRSLRLTHVFETHIHNDYVTGGLELARSQGAEYVLSAEEDVAYEHRGIRDGEVVTTGGLRIRALHTPGHTFHHLSYSLEDAAQGAHTAGTGDARGPGGSEAAVVAVFTGGSMLYGTTGRTDLLGAEHTDTLTRHQFASVRRLARELPAETQVLPTHGFGSFCSATPASSDESTIGEERRNNPALTMEEQEYVDSLLSGLDAYPAYYARMAPLNQAGPHPVDLSLPEQVDGSELRRRIDRGEWVVDLRDRKAFAAGHLAGSLAFELSDSFVTYLGWLYQWGTPLTLVGETRDQVAAARRELVRIGIDALAGMAVDDLDTLAAGSEVRSYPVSDFAGLAKVLTERDVIVLDARRDDERAAGGVRGSLHVPLHELSDRLGEVPDGEVWIYCGSGYRAAIAASVLDRPGRQVVLVDDPYDAARDAGLED